MKIFDFFENDINRNIETVIKADDIDNISNEVAEYVITNEISKKIRDLFSNYNSYAGANGVWISGFFGSGKSHLLKILSYVFENRTFDGYRSGDLFAEKIEQDELLKADILSATRIPSESILFNIDQQAQITSKTDENAILSVFYKVFYDHMGFYGFQPHVAEFEMWLDKQGQFEKFKSGFLAKNGKDWKIARLDYFDPMVLEHMAQVLAELNNTDSSKYENILDQIEDRHKQSIEDFCQRVQDYIDRKPKGFRLNFFVDEIGQYISDNTKLMLNLQTIAETLATKTKGGSWILVTSQEDMESVMGDMNKSQQNDFSRIQARFKLKIPLTSANVDEVIEKRLLKKKDDTKVLLTDIYKKEHAHLSTLLSFSDAGVQFKGFKGENDFANKLPFIPYQFDLFQQCRRALSTHNAFQGKHASVGERSMLSVFQQVAKSLGQQEHQTFVSFDLMFEGIRNELRGEIQQSITLAERNLGNPFAIQVLKTLFLVKYYTSFKTTKRNITVLMISSADVDIKAHEQKVEEALNMLELQNYVQRNGDIYEYLTDDEKDVEQAIKDTDLDEQAITVYLKELFFDSVIKDSKLKFLGNRQDYEFTSKIDGSTTSNREKELEIEIITENNPQYQAIDILKTQTFGSTNMKLILPPNALFMKDVKMYLKTKKYIQQSQNTSNRNELKRILQEKGQLNAERNRNLALVADKSLAEAQVIINGSVQEMNATTGGQTRVINAFQSLIQVVYPNLQMLGTSTFTEDSLKTVLRKPLDELFKNDSAILSEAETEIINLVKRRKQKSDRTSLLDIKNHFAKKPYGWYPNAVWYMVAMAFRRSKIELKKDANLLEEEGVLTALLNAAHHPNTLIEAQTEIDPQQVKSLKLAYSEAFDEPCAAIEAREVGHAFKNKLKGLAEELRNIISRKNEFHFLLLLKETQEYVERLSVKDYTYFLTNLKEFEDKLLDAKELWIDPIKKFLNSEQSIIYNEIRKMMEGNTSNFDYITTDEIQKLRDFLANDKPYHGNLIREAKATKDLVFDKVGELIAKEKEIASSAISKILEDFMIKYEFKALNPTQQSGLLKPLEQCLSDVKEQRYIANIKDIKRRASDEIYQAQLNEMLRLSRPTPVPGENKVEEPPVHYIKRSNVPVKFNKTELQTESDVSEYVDALKEALLTQIKENRRITI